jgi:hypothetical protein
MRSSLASLVPSVSVRIARADILLRGPRTTPRIPGAQVSHILVPKREL